jgi:hypothetical protein
MRALQSRLVEEGRPEDGAEASADGPTPCLWNGCCLWLWHVGDHVPQAASSEQRIEDRTGAATVTNDRVTGVLLTEVC